MRQGDRWRAVGVVVLVGLILSGRPVESDEPSSSPAATPGGGVEKPRLVHLAPGTAVDGTLDGGWTARVIRSVPRLVSGQLATLPETARASATLFHTTVLAESARGRDGFTLRRVGVGNAVPFGGHDVVVTPEGPAEVRASLSTVERIVANAAYDEISRGRLAARTPTFALFRTPARLVIDGAHKAIDLYYAILADPASGAVRTLAWATLPGKTAPPGRVTLLPPDFTFDCPLDVAVDGKIGPVNVSWSFAMASLPPGRKFDLPPDTARLIDATAAGHGDPEALERALRGLIEVPDVR
jgi:hypothetical protein